MPLFHHEHKTLHYLIANNSFHEDVLFLHGNLSSVNWWQPTVDLLRSQKESSMHGRLVAVDWLGCGKSSAPKSVEDLSMESLASDHVALAKASRPLEREHCRSLDRRLDCTSRDAAGAGTFSESDLARLCFCRRSEVSSGQTRGIQANERGSQFLRSRHVFDHARERRQRSARSAIGR